MINIESDIIYNNVHMVIIPKLSEQYLEDYQFSFNNCVVMNNSLGDIEKYANFINRNNFKSIVFIDYQQEYEELIRRIKKKVSYSWIYTKSLSSLSNEYNKYMFDNVFKLFEQGIISKFGILDEGLYKALKKQSKNIYKIYIDTKTPNCSEKKIKSNTFVGLLNDQNQNICSFYNELSAIELDNCSAGIYKPTKETKKFVKLFNIKHKYFADFNELFNGKTTINLNINFTDTDILLFLKSMDSFIPCILGNCSFLDKYTFLKNNLVVNSDDNIDEIAYKINHILNMDKKQLFQDYKKFRIDYSNLVKNNNALFFESEENTKNKEYQKLISIIVPVYNTEKYLSKCLNSILKAIPASLKNEVEILIINDGSTDNSESVIDQLISYDTGVNIRYIKQTNHGLGNVRNVGLKEAKGKYIASIDSDDTINPQFIIESINYLKDDIDVVIYDWLTITNSEKYVTPAVEWVFNKKPVYDGLLYTTIMPSTCNKIFKKSLFDDLKISYIEDRYEDLSTNPFLLLYAKKIKYINKPLYEYYIRSDSIMRSSSGLSMIDVLNEFYKRFGKYKKYCNLNIEEFIYYVFSWRIEEYIINPIYNIQSIKEKKEYVNYIYKNFNDILNLIFNNKYYQEMVNNLKNKDYFIKRNNAIINKKLIEYIDKGEVIKLTPSIIYFGE